jgi:hypothetical protein
MPGGALLRFLISEKERLKAGVVAHLRSTGVSAHEELQILTAAHPELTPWNKTQAVKRRRGILDEVVLKRNSH